MTDEKTNNDFSRGGSERKTPFANFNFTYLDSPLYQNSQSREAIERLSLPELFIGTVEKAGKDLGVTTPVSVTVLALPTETGKFIIPSLGIGARTISDKEVIFQFDPDHPKVVESLNKWQKRQIAHEFNHVVRGISDETLLDALVFEGLATVYEENWGGERLETEWGHALQQDQLKAEWQKAQKELDSTDYDYHGWFFGTNKSHPKWTGYALGTAIVQNYLRLHPDIPMRELVRKPSKEFLEKFDGL